MDIAHLYLFHNSFTHLPGLRLDIENGIFTLQLLKWTYKPLKVIIDTNVLPVNTTTGCAYNHQTNEFYPLYHYRELVRALNTTSIKLWNEIRCNNYIQIDKKVDESLFVKVFIPKIHGVLQSNTHDFTNVEYLNSTAAMIHQVDAKYQHQWRFHSINQENDIVDIKMNLNKRWKEPVYLSHAGQVKEIQEGFNRIIFKYVPSNNIQILVGDKTFTNWKYDISPYAGVE